MLSVPECQACSVCCFSQLDTYVRVWGADHSRLAERAEDLVRFDGNRAYMKMVGGHCAALVLSLGSEGFTCSAYLTRPQICRDLARGSSACHGELEAKALRPLLALGKAPHGSRPPYFEVG